MKINNSLLATIPVLLCAVIATTGCSSSMKISLDVPERFSEQATRHHVEGAKGSGFTGAKSNLRFAGYYADDVKRGWTFSKSVIDKTGFSEAMEQTVLINFGIEKNKITSSQNDKYQFTLKDDKGSAFVFCQEQTTSSSTRISTRYTGEINTMKGQRYNFAATIFPTDINPSAGWMLELGYDLNTPGGMLATVIRDGLPVEKGFITNKADTITVKPVYVKRTKNYETGKAGNFPITLLGGYEFRIGEGVAAIVDVINDNIWFYNGLGRDYKIVIAAAASAILLRRER
ncbi:MAG: hypothetical protein J0L54_08445 [Chitinophagales bacterium]|nr:hypothetical protein [Chitinophagales bacterium]